MVAEYYRVTSIKYMYHEADYDDGKKNTVHYRGGIISMYHLADYRAKNTVHYHGINSMYHVADYRTKIPCITVPWGLSTTAIIITDSYQPQKSIPCQGEP